MKISMRFLCVFLVITLLGAYTAYADGEIKTTARSVILIEQSTGQVLYEQNADEKLPIASVTKVMTMLLCMEALKSGKISMDEQVTASEHACSMGGSQVYLEPGEQMSVSDMIKAIAVASGNDAAVAMSEHIMGSEQGFVDAMNARAHTLGMKNTHFVNCNGLDADDHYSTARDVAVMSAELLKYDEIRPFLKIWMDSLRDGAFGLANTNKLIRFYPNAIGIKTGSTGKAKYCVSGAAQRDGLTLIAVVLAADTTADRFETAKSLLNYGFANYGIDNPVKPGEKIGKPAVIKGVSPSVDVITQRGFSRIVPKGSGGKTDKKIIIQEKYKAPVAKNSIAGEMVLSENGKEIAKIPLVFADNVKKLSVINVYVDLLKYWGGQK